MRKFHSIAALCGDGLRPELQELFDQLAVDPYSELFVRSDGMIQSGPDPVAETAVVNPIAPWREAISGSAKETAPASGEQLGPSENCARAARHKSQNAEGPPGFLSSGH